MEIKESGLKFRKLHDNLLLVETDDEAKMNYFSEPEMSHKILSHNFQQLENFCQENHENINENCCFRFYTVIENFSDENIHFPGKESMRYNIYQDALPDISFALKFFVNEKVSENENQRFVCIDLFMLNIMICYLKILAQSEEHVSCFISLIDNEGKERFTQTIMISCDDILHFMSFDEREPLYKFISRDDVLHHASELLHFDHLVLYARLVFPNDCTDFFIKILDCFKDFVNNVPLLKNLNSVQFAMELKQRFETSAPPSEFDDDFSILDIHSSIKDIAHQNLLSGDLDFDNFTDEFLNVIKLSINSTNKISINDVVTRPDPAKFEVETERFQKDCNDCSKFVCNTMNPVRQRYQEKDFQFEHIHYASSEYLKCENPIIPEKNCISLHFDPDQIEGNLNFSSVFDKNDKEDPILQLDSHFGRTMCQISNVFRTMLKHPCIENLTHEVTIKKEFFEALKNIYRLSRRTRYIKADTIHDIISLYKASDFYDIPILMEFCRKLFKRHICISNADSIRKLSEMYSDDADLRYILYSFEADFDRFCFISAREKDLLPTKSFYSIKNEDDEKIPYSFKNEEAEKSPYFLKNEDFEDIQYDFYQ